MNIMEKVDITKPYFFVSYACVDEVQVYTDIRRLQKYSLQGTTQGNGLTGGVPPVRFSM